MKMMKMTKTMEVSCKRTSAPALYWDVAKLVWEYLIEDVDEAILYEQPLYPWQIVACQRAITVLLKPLQKFFDHHESMQSGSGCATACLMSPCESCFYMRPLEMERAIVFHESYVLFVKYVYARYMQVGLYLGEYMPSLIIVEPGSFLTRVQRRHDIRHRRMDVRRGIEEAIEIMGRW